MLKKVARTLGECITLIFITLFFAFLSVAPPFLGMFVLVNNHPWFALVAFLGSFYGALYVMEKICSFYPLDLSFLFDAGKKHDEKNIPPIIIPSQTFYL